MFGYPIEGNALQITCHDSLDANGWNVPVTVMGKLPHGVNGRTRVDITTEHVPAMVEWIFRRTLGDTAFTVRAWSWPRRVPATTEDGYPTGETRWVRPVITVFRLVDVQLTLTGTDTVIVGGWAEPGESGDMWGMDTDDAASDGISTRTPHDL